jgi:hypothetical protein
MDDWMNRMIRSANGMNSFGIGMGSFGTDEKDGMNRMLGWKKPEVKDKVIKTEVRGRRAENKEI